MTTRRQMEAALALRGYFGVVAYRPKSESNVGTLWRTAATYDAAFIATIGERYLRQPSDTCETPRHTPLWQFEDFDGFLAAIPRESTLVAVELDDRAVDLAGFQHPDRAIYLLGAEDKGLPPDVLKECDSVIQIPSPASWSLNVAVAGSVAIVDRFLKNRQKETV